MAARSFKLIEENGNFYGRGTTDNKAGVVALVSTILRIKAEKLKPARELVFAFVGDEETNMNTTRQIAAHPWVKNAEFAINTDAGGGIVDEASGKPLIYLVQGAEKTYATFDIVVTNQGGHSSRPRADNASISSRAEKIGRIDSGDGHRPHAFLSGRSAEASVRTSGRALRKFAADKLMLPPTNWRSRRVHRHDTNDLRCNVLDAGHAENALPQTASCGQLPHFPWRRCRLRARCARRRHRRSASEVIVRGTPRPAGLEMRPDVMAAITRAVHADYRV